MLFHEETLIRGITVYGTVIPRAVYESVSLKKEVLFTTLINILKLEEIRHKEFRYSYNKKWYSVPYGDIVYFSSRNKLVYIHKKSGETVSYYGKLKDITDDLPFQFTCVSKSYIVNIKYISTWSSGSLILEGGMEINIAQSRRTDFKKAIFNYRRGGVTVENE